MLEKITERMNLIMNIRKTKLWKKVAAFALLAVLMVSNSMVSMACTEETAETVAAKKAPVFDVVYDMEFVDMDGNVYPVNVCQPQLFCPGHDWIDGYAQLHEKNDDGSCVVKVFNSKRCPWCNSVTIDSLFATYHYMKCPHANTVWG